tara:strand:+ start:856 stop:1440 length:585 start_codon:yes stop_codon:yes gene_type:complete
MSRKIFSQILLLIITFLIIYLFFDFYFLKKKIKNTSTNIIMNDDSAVEDESNYIHNIEYISQDSRGNEFIIKSKTGKLDENNMGIILLSSVTAEIRSANASSIFIYSDKAIYNNSNYDTNFYHNVVLDYEDNTITSDKLDLMFSEDQIVSYDDVFYTNLKTTLNADKVIVDLITKNSKILMYNKKNKINIISNQ